MKSRKVFILLFVVISHIGIGAEQSQIFKVNEQINDYVIYSDNRNGNSIFEIMNKGNNSYIVRKYNIDTKEELIYKISYEIDETNIASKEFIIIKGKDDGDYMELMDFTLLIQAKDKIDSTNFPNDIGISQDYGEGDNKKHRDYVFEYWVPVLNLYSVDFGDNKSLELRDMKRGSKEEDERFYSITGWPTVINGPSFIIEKKDKISIKYDQFKVSLDKNWKQDGNTMVLSVKTPRDSQIALNNYKFDPDKSDAIKLCHVIGAIKMLSLNFPIFTDSLRISQESNCLIMDYYVYNPMDKMSTHIFDIFKPTQNKLIDNITIYSYASLFIDNRAYYEDIVKSIIGNTE
jgi:hypothetical protein